MAGFKGDFARGGVLPASIEFSFDNSQVISNPGPPLDRSNEFKLTLVGMFKIKPTAFWVLLRAWGMGEPTAVTMPVHDPPVAWLCSNDVTAALGIEVVCCPALLLDGVVPLWNAPEIPVLDSEPGRLPHCPECGSRRVGRWSEYDDRWPDWLCIACEAEWRGP